MYGVRHSYTFCPANITTKVSVVLHMHSIHVLQANPNIDLARQCQSQQLSDRISSYLGIDEKYFWTTDIK